MVRSMTQYKKFVKHRIVSQKCGLFVDSLKLLSPKYTLWKYMYERERMPDRNKSRKCPMENHKSISNIRIISSVLAIFPLMFCMLI